MNAFGVYGVGVMGRGLALNIASKGHRVAIFNKEVERTHEVMRDAERQNIRTIRGYDTVRDFMSSLEKPKKILMMVPSGKAVDEVLSSMSPYIQKGDILVDGGNEWYKNTEARQAMLQQRYGASLVGMGVSGGAEGARHGAAFMPGGDHAAVQAIMSFLKDASDPHSVVSYVGAGGSGNYVKMVHNGIEYAIMQIIAEVYHVLKTAYMLDNKTISAFFQEVNQFLDSYLIEITIQILGKEDDVGDGGYIVDKILDVARMNGTGTWTAKEAFEVLVPCPSIAAAANARLYSESRSERLEMSRYIDTHIDYLPNPDGTMLRKALTTSMYMAYLQGFMLIKKKNEQKKWGINLENVARSWMGGCIIRSNILNFFASTNPELYQKLLFKLTSGSFEDVSNLMSICANACVSTPVLSATFQYILGYTNARSPANLIQAQRDFFGSHGYQRIDIEGRFTTKW